MRNFKTDIKTLGPESDKIPFGVMNIKPDTYFTKFNSTTIGLF